MAAHAQAVNDRAEAEKVLGMVPLKHPDAPFLPMKMPSPDEIRLFRVTPASGRTRPDHRWSQFGPTAAVGSSLKQPNLLIGEHSAIRVQS